MKLTPAAAVERHRQGQRLLVVTLLTGAFLIVEAVGGFLSGSLALLSDAGHMLTDLLALVLSLMTARFASLPANPDKTYGYHRLEILTALVNGSLLVVISIALAWQSVVRVLHPVPVKSGMMMAVAIAGLAANIAGLMLLSDAAHSLNMRGARMHVLGDALSSAGVVAASIVMAFTGWYRLDPLLAGGIAVVIAVGAVRLVREAVDVLLESAPAGIHLEDVSQAILTVPGVSEVHDLHVWSITTGLPALSGHVRVGPAGSAAADELLARIKKTTLRDRFGIVHSTIQIESPRFEEPGDVCATS